MKRLLLFLLLCTLAGAEIIPSTRRLDWYGNVGVTGGIPVNTTIYTTLTSSATGADITAAIAACPVDQVVKLAAGTYSISTAIDFATKSRRTLRGSGTASTILNFTVTGDACFLTDDYGFTGAAAISSGYTKGSTAVVMSGTPNAAVATGMNVMFDQDDDTALIFTANAAGRRFNFTARVTSVSGTTVNFTPPLPYTLTAGKTPKLSYLSGGPGISLSGVEDLKVNNNGPADNVFHIRGADRFWVKNVEITNIGSQGIWITEGSNQCEVRHCYIHDAASYPNNADGYAIYPHSKSGNHLIEDNILDKCGAGVFQTGSSGNAYLFNYSREMRFGAWDKQTGGFNSNHGAYPMFNLWEGNVSEMFQCDGYHGSAGYQTLFRCWFHGINPLGYITNRKCVSLERGSYYHNVVGNVLGSGTWSGPGSFQYEMTGQPDYADAAVIYRLGYPNVANNGTLAGDVSVTWTNMSNSSYPDVNVAATLARHGNYDYKNAAQVWETTDANVTDHTDQTIPDSLYYPSKPAYFGNCPWPPFSPTAPGNAAIANIPAGYRYLNGSDPPTGTVIRVGN